MEDDLFDASAIFSKHEEKPRPVYKFGTTARMLVVVADKDGRETICEASRIREYGAMLVALTPFGERPFIRMAILDEVKNLIFGGINVAPY